MEVLGRRKLVENTKNEHANIGAREELFVPADCVLLLAAPHPSVALAQRSQYALAASRVPGIACRKRNVVTINAYPAQRAWLSVGGCRSEGANRVLAWARTAKMTGHC